MDAAGSPCSLANGKTNKASAKNVEVLQTQDETDSTSNMEQLKRKKNAKKVTRTYHCHFGS
jgi:hypothetical protein